MTKKILSFFAMLFLTGQVVLAADIDKHSVAYISQRVDTIYSRFGHCDMDSSFCSDGYKDIMRQVYGQMGEDDILFDYDHWINAQDYDRTLSAKVDSVALLDDVTATVRVLVRNFGKDSEVNLKLRFEHGDWFVDDFLAPDGENDRDYMVRMICTILSRRLGLTDESFRGTEMTKYSYVDVDGDGYPELWLRSANDKLGAVISMIGNSQLLAKERYPQKVVFYRGALVVRGACGQNCETVKVVSMQHSRKAHVIEYIMTIPTELGRPIYEYLYDGREVNPAIGKKYLQRAMQIKREQHVEWHSFQLPED